MRVLQQFPPGHALFIFYKPKRFYSSSRSVLKKTIAATPIDRHGCHLAPGPSPVLSRPAGYEVDLMLRNAFVNTEGSSISSSVSIEADASRNIHTHVYRYSYEGPARDFTLLPEVLRHIPDTKSNAICPQKRDAVHRGPRYFWCSFLRVCSTAAASPPPSTMPVALAVITYQVTWIEKRYVGTSDSFSLPPNTYHTRCFPGLLQGLPGFLPRMAHQYRTGRITRYLVPGVTLAGIECSTVYRCCCCCCCCFVLL